ncbi:MAG: DUF4091 domain-containing protein [Clostridia bacterium]|nr:DUF4091 domain-containing protein [Clostridia bacterium]
MMKDKPLKTNRTAVYLLGSLLLTGLFALFLYLFHAVYIPWVQFGLVGAWYVLATLSIGGMAVLTLITNPKKAYTKAGVIVRALIVMAVFTVLIFGVSYVFNLVLHYGSKYTVYADNECALRIVYSLAIIQYGVLLALFLMHLSPKKPVKAVGVLALLACIGVGAALSWFMVPTQTLYPLCRVFVPQGGVKTADKQISYDFAYATEKLQPTDTIGKDGTFTIRLAKNEREGLQLALSSEKDGKKVTVSVGNFVNAAGDEIPVRFYKERYVSVPGWGSAFSDEYPDALELMTAETALTLQKNRLQPVFIEAVSDKKTPAGDYTAKCEIRNEAGEVIAETEITASVWDLALPDAPATESAMGIFSSEFWNLMGLDESTIYGHNGNNGSSTLNEEQFKIYKQYYDYLLSHHLSPYELPYDILDERADAYMSDPRVTSFCVPYPGDDELLKQYYDKVTSNEEWAKKAYFYPIDEPNDEEAYARYIEITDRLSRLCPGYNMVTPFYSNDPETEGGQTAVSLQRGRSSILCPESVVLDADGAKEELYAARDEAGARIWWYVCCGPTGDYNNNFIRQDGIRHRLLFWQEKMEDVTGFLYWNSIYCDKGNPWETSKTWESYESGGDGVLMYPGRYAGYDEPVGTLRLKNLCDGIEDYTYLTLAEEKLGREWVDARIAQLTTSLTEYTLDDALLQQVRNEIGEALSK